MIKPILFFIALALSNFGLSQKLVEKTVVNPKTKFIEINGDKCFKISMLTHASNVLKVEATMEGEYAKDLALKVEEDGDNINISADFLPSFNAPNDKLSAHKVISIALKVTLPEHVNASVYGTTTHVWAQGTYKNLTISLADGNCTLNSVAESIDVKTQKGEISVSNAKGTVTVKSEYGKVYRGDVPEGFQTFTLHSVEGDIWVNKNHG